MADVNIQRVGFDASQAIAELTSLNQALAQTGVKFAELKRAESVLNEEGQALITVLKGLDAQGNKVEAVFRAQYDSANKTVTSVNELSTATINYKTASQLASEATKKQRSEMKQLEQSAKTLQQIFKQVAAEENKQRARTLTAGFRLSMEQPQQLSRGSSTELAAYESSLNKLEHTLDRNRVKAEEFGRAVTALGQGSLKELTLRERELALEIRKTQEAYKAVGTELSKREKSDALKKEKQENENLERTIKRFRNIFRAARDADVQDTKEVEDAVKRFGQIFKEVRDRTVKDSKDVDEAVRGFKKIFDDINTERARREFKQFEQSIRRVRDMLREAAQNERNALSANLTRGFRDNLGPTSVGSVQEVTRFEKALSALERTLTRNNVTIQEYENAIRSLASGDLANLTLRERNLVTVLARVAEAHERVGDSTRRRSEAARQASEQLARQEERERALQAQQRTAAALVRAFRNNLGPTAVGTVSEITAYEAALNRLERTLSRNRVTAQEYQNAIRALHSGDLSSLTLRERELTLALTRSAEAHERVGRSTRQRAEAAAQSIARARQQRQEEARLNQELANRRRAGAAATSLVRRDAGIIPRGSVEQMLEVERALDRVNQLFVRGRVTAADYGRVVQALATRNLQGLTAAQIQLASAIQNVNRTFAATAPQAINLGNAMRRAGQQGGAAGYQVTLSWQSVVRLFAVQTLHRLFADLVSLFRRATEEAIQFSSRIAEIQTLTQRNAISASAWAANVRQLSDAFGQTNSVIAEGVYEAVSNQVVRAADAFRFMRDSLEFSLAAVTDAANASNLLASAINSFELATSDADSVAAKFFTIIDLGRVRADDLANTFGRVGPIAKALGISLEEVGAAIATISIQGVRPGETLTQISSLMQKLFQPTDAMKDLFQEWGVANAQAAIATFGFQGVLGLLNVEAAKGTDRLGELVSLIRGVRGIVGLTGNSFDEFNRSLEQIKNSGTDYKNAIDIVRESTGKQLQIEFQSAMTFVTEFIGTLQESVLVISKTFGGFAETLKSVIRIVGTSATALVAFRVSLVATAAAQAALNVATFAQRQNVSLLTSAYIQLRVALNASAVSANLARGSLAALSGPIGIVAALVSGLLVDSFLQATFRANEFSNNVAKRFDELEEAARRSTQRVAEAFDRMAFDLQESLTRGLQGVLRLATERLRLERSVVSETVKLNEEAAKATKKIGDTVLESLRTRLRELSSQFNDFKNNAEKTQKAISEMEFKFADQNLQNKLSVADPTEQAEILKDRLLELRKQFDDLSKAPEAERDYESILKILEEANRTAQRLFELQNEQINNATRAEDQLANKQNANKLAQLKQEQQLYLQQLAAIDKQLKGGNLTLQQQQRLENRRQEILNKQQQSVVLEQELAKTQADLAALLAAREAAEKSIATIQALQLAQQKEAAELAAKQRDEAEQAAKASEANVKLFEETFKQLTEFTLKDSPFGSTEEALSAFDELANRLKEIASKEGLDVGQRIELVQSLATQRAAIEKQIDAEIAANSTEAFQKGLIDKLNALKQFSENARQLIQDATADVNTQTNTVTANVEELLKIFEKGNASGPNSHAAELLPTATALKEALAAFRENSSASNFAELQKTFQAYSQALREIDNRLKGSNLFGGGGRLLNEEQVEGINNTVSAINELALALNKVQQGTAEYNETRLAIEELLEQIRELPEEYRRASEAAISGQENVRAEIRKTAAELRKLIAEFAEFNASRPPIPATTNSFGRYFAHGGRGLDQVLGYFDPKEFIVKSSVAQKNYSRLVAMNAGYHSQGGHVTNVGDINVTVQGGDTSEQTATSIARSLRRQIRQRRISF